MGCENDQLTVKRGSNLWVLARTDRDAPTESDVVDTTGAFLVKTLGAASPIGQRGALETIQLPGHEREWAIGAARPVALLALGQPETQEQSAELLGYDTRGQLLGRYTDCPTLRTLAGQRPWLMALEFDWRAPDTRIPWPRRKTIAGVAVDDDTDLDWLLLGAAYQGVAKQPDTTLVRETWREATKATTRAARSLSGPLRIAAASAGLGAGLAGVYFVARRFRGKTKRKKGR